MNRRKTNAVWWAGRAVGFVAVFAVGWLAAVPAESRPVRVGRYTELPYGVSTEHPYPTGAADARRTGRIDAPSPEREPTKVWEARIRAGRPSAPAIDEEGRIYVANAAGVAGVAPNGAVLFTARLGFVSATPSITPTGDLVVGTHAGTLVILSRSGEIRQQTTVGGPVRGSPLVLADGSAVVGAFDQAVHRFDADGRRLFRVAIPFQVSGSIAWTTSRGIWVAASDRLLRMNAQGEVIATTVIGSQIVSGPAVADDGSVWVVGQDENLRQLAPSGTLRSTTALGAPVSPAGTLALARDGSVRVPTRGDALVCVGPTGTERWRLTGEGSFLGGAVLDENDNLLAVNERGILLSVNAEGQVRWRVNTGNRTDLAPVLSKDGTVYVATVRGTLQAWR
ncbi:MAG: PQQ-binding-like beta-propeller repeat protein [Myxococcota bacterium]